MEMQVLKPAILQNLQDAGCDREIVERYCELEMQQRPKQTIRRDQIQLLCRQRKELLNDLHQCQQRLDCLDYLIFQMKEEQKENKP